MLYDMPFHISVSHICVALESLFKSVDFEIPQKCNLVPIETLCIAFVL
jgi:hypothetical protein